MEVRQLGLVLKVTEIGETILKRECDEIISVILED